MARKKASVLEDAFIQKIVENPNDDTPRMIFADWLEELGDPRGTFIRVQCQLATINRHHPDWSNLLAQESALLNRHGAEWRKPIERDVDVVRFRRGFIEHVELSATSLLRNGEKLLRLVPTIRHLRISQLKDRLPDIANAEWMRNISGLDLQRNLLGGRALQALVQSPNCRLEWLSLNTCELNAASIACFADAPGLRSLTHLELGNNHLGAAGAEVLARSPLLENLRSLGLAGNHLDGKDAGALTTQTVFRLHSLNLSSNTLGNDGVAALARCPQFAALKALDLGHNQISNLGVQALAGSPNLSQLEILKLNNNRINDQGLKILAASATFANLVQMNVNANEFSRAAAESLLACTHFPRMQSLEARIR